MADLLSTLDTYVEQHIQEHMRELAVLCDQPSVSAQGLGIDACAHLVARMLDRRGITARIMETGGHPVVYGEYGEGDRTLLLYNHYDVQPPEPLELWNSPPFETTQRDGKLFARGTADDKGDIVSRLAAFDAYRAVYGDLPYRLKFLIEGEEEIGSPHLHTFIRDHQDLLAADACVWEAGWTDHEGRLLMYLGLRGIVSVELRLRTIKYDAHSGLYSALPNAAWRLVWALATLKDQQEHILIPGFYDDVRPPTQRQRELLAALPSQEEQEKIEHGFTRYAGKLSGQNLKESVFLPTCTINGLGSGYQGEGSKTIIPAEASCKIDFRLVPDQDPQDVIRKLRAHLDAQGFNDIEIHAEPGERAGVVDPDDPFVQLALQAARTTYGKEPVVNPLIGGSGPYAAFLEYLHTPIVASGVSYPGSLGHAPNEHIRITDWILGTRHMARILTGFSQL
ncbi:MAG: M20/M25/M40 family metallo-hydrolase [Ktedonobacteraceae bacterium]|nr:M20/M25/M40 family metallo-hydrolase [Ktedonobacteraceae bacterium]